MNKAENLLIAWRKSVLAFEESKSAWFKNKDGTDSDTLYERMKAFEAVQFGKLAELALLTDSLIEE